MFQNLWEQIIQNLFYRGFLSLGLLRSSHVNLGKKIINDNWIKCYFMCHHSILKKKPDKPIMKNIYLHHTQHTVRGIYRLISFDTRTFLSETTGVRWSWTLVIENTRLIQRKISYKIIHELLWLLLH